MGGRTDGGRKNRDRKQDRGMKSKRGTGSRT